jgi:hypothetical protein
MFRRPRQLVRRFALPVLGVLVLAGGLALAFMPDRSPQTATVTPQTSTSPSASPSGSPDASPAISPEVAGSQTAAPAPNHSGHTGGSTAQPPAQAPAAPPPAPAVQTVTLKLVINGQTQRNSVALVAGRKDPCLLLHQARDEGKIASVTLKYYGAPLHSNYVSELNGFKEGWTFKRNGAGSPVGCSKVPLQPGDVVTWQFA